MPKHLMHRFIAFLLRHYTYFRVSAWSNGKISEIVRNRHIDPKRVDDMCLKYWAPVQDREPNA